MPAQTRRVLATETHHKRCHEVLLMLLVKLLLVAAEAAAMVAQEDHFAQDVLNFVLNEYQNATGSAAAVPVVPAPAAEVSTSQLALTTAVPMSHDDFALQDFRVETGLFFDLNKGDDDDCEEEKKEDDCGGGGLLLWLFPFSVDQPESGVRKVQVPPLALLGPAFEDSHGLFVGEPPRLNHTWPRVNHTLPNATSIFRSTTAPPNATLHAIVATVSVAPTSSAFTSRSGTAGTSTHAGATARAASGAARSHAAILYMLSLFVATLGLLH